MNFNVRRCNWTNGNGTCFACHLRKSHQETVWAVCSSHFLISCVWAGFLGVRCRQFCFFFTCHPPSQNSVVWTHFCKNLPTKESTNEICVKELDKFLLELFRNVDLHRGSHRYVASC